MRSNSLDFAIISAIAGALFCMCLYCMYSAFASSYFVRAHARRSDFKVELNFINVIKALRIFSAAQSHFVHVQVSDFGR